jgi:hypothetical protein
MWLTAKLTEIGTNIGGQWRTLDHYKALSIQRARTSVDIDERPIVNPVCATKASARYAISYANAEHHRRTTTVERTTRVHHLCALTDMYERRRTEGRKLQNRSLHA